MSAADLDETGPIDYLVVEFPADAEPDGSALSQLLDLSDRGIISVIDLAFIAKSDDGTVATIDIAEVGLGGDIDVPVFAEASTGVVGDDDVAEVGAIVEPGRIAAILVYENTWAVPFATALRAAGAQLVASGRIPIQAMLASLDAQEQTD